MEKSHEHARTANAGDDIGIERKESTGPSGGRRPRGSGEANSFREYKSIFSDVMSYCERFLQEEDAREHPRVLRVTYCK